MERPYNLNDPQILALAEKDPLIKRDLFNDNIALVWKFYWRLKYILPDEPKEELFQELSLAFSKALNSFDPNKGFTFSTFFGKIAFNHMIKLRRANRSRDRIPRDRLYSIDESLVQPDNSEVYMEEVLKDSYNLEQDAINRVILRELIEELKKNTSLTERRMLYWTLLGLSQKNIGEKVGKSQAQVSSSIIKLRKRLMNRL